MSFARNGALRSPAFLQIWGSALMSAGGQGMERTATAWLVLVAGGSAVDVGVTFAARMLPSLLFGLVAGTIADRAERARQLLVVALTTLVIMVSFGLLVGRGEVQVWWVIIFSFLAGCVQVFDTPARQALVLDAVPRDVALRALALVALAARFASAVGAVSGGVLISLIGVGNTFVVIGIVYGIAAALVATLRVVQSHRTREAPPPFSHALRDAARLMVDIPTLRVLIFAGIACEVFAFSYMTAVPLFVQDVLQAGAEELGLLNAAASIGGAVAVALLSLLSGGDRREPLLAAVFVVYGLAILSLAATRDLGLAAVVLLVIGFCAGAFDLLQQTLIQMSVPDAQRGRAVGIWVLSIGSAPLGHLEMGVLMAAIGVPAALLANGALTLFSALLLLCVPAFRFRIGKNKNED